MNNTDYQVIADYLDDRLGDDPLADHARAIAARIIVGVASEEVPDFCESKHKGDGSWQFAATAGTRWVLLGCDKDEVNRLIYLNYLKWDRWRQGAEWFAGIWMNDPKV